MEGWEDYVANSTDYTGRVWTDKSVFVDAASLSPGGSSVAKSDGSDFLVGLSALSSASSLTSTKVQPLDIVLVLDVSGSMASDYGAPSYGKVFSKDLDTSRTYYIKDAEQYRSVAYNGARQRWYYGSNPNQNQVVPKTSEGDSNPQHVQFYSMAKTTRMDALKSSVGQFLARTEDENGKISDESLRHRVSLVKFAGSSSNNVGNQTYTDYYTYNYSQVVSDFSTNIDALKGKVDALSPGGATRADYGMNHAGRVLGGDGSLVGARADAGKVVIFFTDGEPTSGSSFEASVANSAIASAHTLKDGGATVYSAGIFNGADSGITTDTTNAFMHGISSNYPDATRYNRLGERADGSDYYKAASDPENLAGVFDDIFEQIFSGTGAPTKIEEGFNPSKSGYLTFTDPLGAYMRVFDFNAIAYGDKIYAEKSVAEVGNVTTYTFSGTMSGSSIYPDANMADIVIEVKRSDVPSEGDVVTVKVPASNIPLRFFEVSNEEGALSMDISDAHPLRMFYSVGLKEGARELLSLPDEAMRAYIAASSDDGNVRFYANKYELGSSLGSAKAVFEPASANSFYFSTSDTPLYLKSEQSGYVRASAPVDLGKSYYYSIDYYEKSGSVTTAQRKWIPLEGEALSVARDFVSADDQGNLYVRKGCQRNDRIGEVSSEKSDNVTGTAAMAISPVWAGRSVQVALGNNGLLEAPLPGTLSVAKHVEVPPGFDPSNYAATMFPFSVNVPAMKGLTAQAKVVGSSGETAAPLFDIQFDGEGVARQSLKDGEVLYIYGLPAGVDYSVSEDDPLPAGFRQTTSEGSSGAVSSSAVSQARFTNTYGVQAVACDFPDGRKIIENRDFSGDDPFSFLVSGRYEGTGLVESVPLPDGVSGGSVGNAGVCAFDPPAGERESGVEFGKLSFAVPGTYRYEVSEVAPSQGLAGMTYSSARYLASFEVADNGKGGLDCSAPSVIRLVDDDGAASGEEAPPSDLSFVNVFDASEVSTGIYGFKEYEDLTGSKPLEDGMFSFELRPVGENAEAAPLPAGSASDDLGRYCEAANVGTRIDFGSVSLGQDDVGKTYSYEMREIVPDEAIQGMTYDADPQNVKVSVGQGDDGAITLSVRYPDSDIGAATFRNVYRAENAALADGNAMGGTKTLVGRDMAEGESYSFKLAPSEATKAAVDAGWVSLGGNSELTASVLGGANGEPVAFSFGGMTFSHVGTYSFFLFEDVPATDSAGLTYDRHVSLATVSVVDEGGRLKAEVDYGFHEGSPGNSFVNRYDALLVYGAAGGLDVSKTLEGRALVPGEFSFRIEACDEVTAEKHPVPVEDALFSNPDGRLPGVPDTSKRLTALVFDESDAGVTYTYRIFEIADEMNGVSYDEVRYLAAVSLVDNGDGTMRAVTSVSKEGSSDPAVEFDSSDGVVPQVSFSNIYQAAPAVSDTSLLSGTKVLDGRDMLPDEAFSFNVEGGDETTRAAIEEGTVDLSSNRVELRDLEEGVPSSFDFGSVTFAAPGVYTFRVFEEQDERLVERGVALDGHVGLVVATVADDGRGSLFVESTAPVAMSFTNTYEAQGCVLDIGETARFAKKLSGRNWSIEDAFDFIVSAEEGAPLPDGGVLAESGNMKITTISSSAAEDEPVPIDLGRIEYRSSDMTGAVLDESTGSWSKDFVYTVTEAALQPAIPGMTYSSASYEIIVTVVDDGHGTLAASATCTQVLDDDGHVVRAPVAQGETAAFTNVYTADDAPVKFSVQKVYDDRSGVNSLSDGDFSVVMKPTGYNAEDAPMPSGSTGEGADRLFTVENAGSVFPLPDIVFTQEDAGKTFSYDLRERIPEGASGDMETGFVKDGVLYDPRAYEVDVSVSLEGDHVVTAIQGIPDGGLLTFENTYDPAGVDLVGETALHGTKNMEGRALAEGETFGFKLSPADTLTNSAISAGYVVVAEDALSAQSSPGDGAATSEGFSFGSVSFKKPGVYRFAITEIQGSAAGVFYDEHTSIATVTVEDGGGALKATVRYDNEDAAREEGAEGAGEAVFTNVYRAMPAEVSTGEAFGLTKMLVGRNGGEWSSTDEFAFVLRALDGAPLPDGTTGSEKRIVVGGSSVDQGIAPLDFGTITFDKPGEYVYEVAEENAGETIGGVTYADNTVVVRASVEDNGAGSLKASVTVENEDEDVSFVNVYSSAALYSRSGVGGLDVTKVLSGRDMESGKFSLRITPRDEASAEKSGISAAGEVRDIPAAADGEEVVLNPFEGMVFDEGDHGSVYAFTLDEVQDSGGGYLCDESVYLVEISPVDRGDGTMLVETSVKDSDGDHTSTVQASHDAPSIARAPFENAYSADPVILGDGGDARIEARKVLSDGVLSKGQFSFEVRYAGDKQADPVSLGVNDEAGAIGFGPIEYTTESLKAERALGHALFSSTDSGDEYLFNYVVSENVDHLDPGYAYVGGNATIQVLVTDDRAGTLSLDVSYPSGAGLVFENSYGADASAAFSIAGNKVLSSETGANAPDIEGRFSFELVGADDAPMPEGSQGNVKTVRNVAGAVDFGKVQISIDDFPSDVARDPLSGKRVQTFSYTVTEAGSIEGVVNDENVKTLIVVVTDNGDGTISVSKDSDGSADPGMDFTFENRYGVAPVSSSPTEDGIAVRKVWEAENGSRVLSGGDFSFEMRDARGKVVSTGINNAEGGVSLSPVTFTSSGTHEFVLTEAVPEGAALLPDGTWEKDGVRYAGDSYRVGARVLDDGSGSLTVAWSLLDETVPEAVFVNHYAAAPVGVSLGALKVLEGRELIDGEFAFDLLDAGGSAAETAPARADGSVRFGKIVFDEVGTYGFSLREVLPSDEGEADGVQHDGVTYDETVHDVTVSIADDGKGRLYVEKLSYDGTSKMPVFTNVFDQGVDPVDPVDPEDPLPGEEDAAPLAVSIAATGDSLRAVLIACLALMAVAATVLVVAARVSRRKRMRKGK